MKKENKKSSEIRRKLRKQHNTLKSQIKKEDIEQIVRCGTPSQAMEKVMERNHLEACALIDSLDDLTAAFVIYEIRRINILNDNYKAFRILLCAEVLKIKGLKGLCHARNKLYKQTGILLV